MDWKEIHRRLLAGLSGEVRGRWGRIAEIEERLGLSGGYLNKLCKGKHEFKLTTFLKALVTADIDPRAFFSRVLEIQLDPVDYLEQIEDGRESDRALERIVRTTRELGRTEPPAIDAAATADASDVAGVVACSMAEQRRRLRSTRKYRTHAFTRAYLEHLDELRYDRAAEAEGLAITVAADLIPKLPGPQRECLSLQCLALGIFGSARRVKGELANAARAFRIALQAASRAELTQDRANLLLRASYVVRDYGHFKRALDLVNQAMVAFVRLGSLRDVGRTLVDHGMMNCGIGNYEEAVRDLRQARRHLEGSAGKLPRYHLACHNLLAFAFEKLGNLEAAEECLAAGARQFGPKHAADRAKLDWQRASLAYQRGDYRLAEALLRSAKDVAALIDHPPQEAMITLDLVSVLLSLNRASEASRLASDMARILGAFESNRIAQAAVLKLISAALAGELSQEVVAETCDRLRASDPTSQAAPR